jgi:hypothetical protein
MDRRRKAPPKRTPPKRAPPRRAPAAAPSRIPNTLATNVAKLGQPSRIPNTLPTAAASLSNKQTDLKNVMQALNSAHGNMGGMMIPGTDSRLPTSVVSNPPPIPTARPQIGPVMPQGGPAMSVAPSFLRPPRM